MSNPSSSTNNNKNNNNHAQQIAASAAATSSSTANRNNKPEDQEEVKTDEGAISTAKRRVRLVEAPPPARKPSSSLSEGGGSSKPAIKKTSLSYPTRRASASTRLLSEQNEENEECSEMTPLNKGDLLSKDVKVINDLIDDLSQLEPGENLPLNRVKSPPVKNEEHPLREGDSGGVSPNPHKGGVITPEGGRAGRRSKRSSIGSGCSTIGAKSESAVAIDTPGITEQVSFMEKKSIQIRKFDCK